MDKTLTPAEVKFLQNFVSEVITTCANDVEGITNDIAELAETAAEILGVDPDIQYEDEPDYDLPFIYS